MSIIPTGITRAIGKSTLALKLGSPKVLFVAGIAGVIGGGVLACRATLKAKDEIDEAKEQLADIREMKESSEKYAEEDYGRDLSYVYISRGVQLAKLYAPSVIVGSLGIAALTGSHTILTRRNAGLTLAYTTLSKTFDEYKDRVAEEFGVDEEFRIRKNVLEKRNEKNEDGESVDVLVAGKPYSPYARLFDELNPNWKNDPNVNSMFLKCVQQHMNNRLVAHGHVFLNEVYDALGFERTKEGAVVGWVYGRHSEGDEYVDFGIFDEYNHPFNMGWEKNVWLDFNVDGVILDNFHRLRNGQEPNKR